MPKNIPNIPRKQYLALLLCGVLLPVLISSSGCGLLLKEKAPDEGLAALSEGGGKSLRAKATVEITGADGKSLSGKAVILARRPDLFRIEFLGPFNQTAALVLSDGGGTYYYSRGRDEYYYTGDPDYPFPFTAAELVAFLFGDGDVSALGDGEDYRVELDGEYRIEALEKIKDGKVLFRASMEDFRKNGERWYPYKIVINDGLQEMRIHYKSLNSGVIIDPGLFKPPEKPPEEEPRL